MKEQNEKQYIGIVKYFNNATGIGTIKCDEIPGDIFLHYSEIIMPDGGFQTVNYNDLVQFELWNTPKGITAKNLKTLPKE